jgi:hypothetical protein
MSWAAIATVVRAAAHIQGSLRARATLSAQYNARATTRAPKGHKAQEWTAPNARTPHESIAAMEMDLAVDDLGMNPFTK